MQMGYIAYKSLSMLSNVGGISSTLAVGLAGVVVVVTVVLVFVMLLRSNGAGKRTATGLGYDAQQEPFGQNPAGQGLEWPAPRGAGNPPGPAGWPQTEHYDYGAAPQGSGVRGANSQGWGESSFGGQMGQMGATGPVSPGGWNSSPAQGAGWATPAGGAAPAWAEPAQPAWGNQNDQWGQNQPGWDAQQASPSRPNANATPGWDSSRGGRASTSGPMPGPAANQWGDQAGMNTPWNSAPAAQATPGRDWSGASSAGVAAGAGSAGWGSGGQGGYDQGFGEGEKTRVVRPSTSQQRIGMIVIRQGKEPGRVFELRKDRLTIGRSRDSDIFLEDLAVSRLHTTVNSDGSGHYIIRDEGSANGTYVNQQRISEQSLEEGDEIQVGQTVLAFVRR